MLSTMRRLLVILFIILLHVATFGQQQHQHEKTTYVDSTGKFFINKDLPVYIRIATSPADDAKSHLLRSKQSKAYTNPMYLDTEGYNTIRSPWAVDPETKELIRPRQDVVFEVYADSRPPSIQADFKNAEHHRDEWGNFYGKGLRILFDARDAVSGIKNIYYSLNGEPFEIFQDSLGFADKEDGEYILKYYAVDNVGNATAIDSVQFSYDTTPAEPRLVLYGVQEGENILSEDSKLLLRSRDNLAGERAIYYSMDNKPFKAYKEPIEAAQLPEGEHSIKYYVVDNVGNVSKTKDGSMEHVAFDFVMDKSPPDVKIVPGNDFYKNDRTYVSASTKVKINANDEKGSVKWTRYNINRKDTLKQYTGSFTLEGEDGWYKIYAKARDFVGNLSDLISKAFYKDTKPPITNVEYVNVHFFARDTLFINKNTRIKLNARDADAGVKSTYYAIDQDAFSVYDQMIALKDEGSVKLRFYSTDRVNNKEREKQSVLYVDNLPPAIHVNFSVPPFDKVKRDGETIPVYPTNTRIFLGATDARSGTDEILYSVDGGSFKTYASGASLADKELFKQPAEYRIEIKARDMLGNEKRKTLKFITRKK